MSSVLQVNCNKNLSLGSDNNKEAQTPQIFPRRSPGREKKQITGSASAIR